jgi:hypothetical protein
MILPYIFFLLGFTHPVQFVVDREQFMSGREYIDRPVHGLISVTKDSTYFRLDSTYASFANFRYSASRKIVQVSFKSGDTYGSLYGIKELVQVQFHHPKKGQVHIKFKVKHSSLEQ